MAKTRRKLDEAFKAGIPAAGAAGRSDGGGVCAASWVHPNQVYGWKRQLLENAAQLFAPPENGGDRAAELTQLYAKIGQLTVERDFLCRRSGL